MNLAIFVTRANRAALPELLARMADLQKVTVNGACVVVHDSSLKGPALSCTLALARRFKASASLPVQVSSDYPEAGQIASMFSRFLTSAYTRYPGPWLLFDDPAEPKGENFMQELLKQHGAYGGRMSGRATTAPGCATPVGPITLELDFKALKFMRFPTRQSWRERGQFLFARAGFQLVPPGEWLFTMRKTESAEPALEVESTQLEPQFSASLTVNDFDGTSDENLARFIEKVSGKKPHHSTGRNKLLSMAKELQATPA